MNPTQLLRDRFDNLVTEIANIDITKFSEDQLVELEKQVAALDEATLKLEQLFGI